MKQLLSCENEILAQEYKGSLEAKGIKCMIKKDTVGIEPSAGGFLAHTTILVEEEKFDEATQIIKGIDAKRTESMPWCPECGGMNVTRRVIVHRHGPNWMLVVGLLVMLACIVISVANGELFIPGLLFIILFIFWFKSYKEDMFHCQDCGKDFKRE